MIAAICPVCGGWTMVHGDPESSTAREWVKRCYVIGELIVKLRSNVALDLACPEVQLPVDERTCASESPQETE